MEQKQEGKLDWMLISTLLLQIIIGTAFIYSVSGGYDEYIKENHPGGIIYFKSYMVALVFSLVIMGLVFRYYSTQFIEKCAYWFVGLAFVLIIATLIPGVGWRVNGASRSINIWLTNVYVIPMSTLFLIVGASRYIAEHYNTNKVISLHTIKIVLVFFLFSILIYSQPDIKTVFLITILLVILCFSAKLYKLCFITALPLILIYGGSIVIYSYRLERLLSFYKPFENSLGTGYQLSASLSTIGGGNLWGVGFSQGLEKHFYFPGAHKGFMFSSVTEEVGAIGALFVIFCEAIILWRSLRVAKYLLETGRYFESLLVTGISSWIALLSLFHMAGCLGLIPVSNVYFPFLSYDKAYVFAAILGYAIVVKIGSTVVITIKREQVTYQPVLVVFLSIFIVLGVTTYSKAVLDTELDKQYEKKINDVNKLIHKFLLKNTKSGKGLYRSIYLSDGKK